MWRFRARYQIESQKKRAKKKEDSRRLVGNLMGSRASIRPPETGYEPVRPKKKQQKTKEQRNLRTSPNSCKPPWTKKKRTKTNLVWWQTIRGESFYGQVFRKRIGQFHWKSCPFVDIFPSLTTFYWIFLGFPGFSWVFLGFPGFSWVLLGFLGFTGFYWVLLGLLSNGTSSNWFSSWNW